jgi:hypothetical protein
LFPSPASLRQLENGPTREVHGEGTAIAVSYPYPMADSASSTKASEADIREDWDELANGPNGQHKLPVTKALRMTVDLSKLPLLDATSNGGCGSPLAAFDATRNSALVLDVAR